MGMRTHALYHNNIKWGLLIFVLYLLPCGIRLVGLDTLPVDYVAHN